MPPGHSRWDVRRERTALFENILRHISKKTLHTVSAVLFILVVAFFALTRTQVGRDELARQLEKQFSLTFQGKISIGKLTGNLFNTMYASDVGILDENGNRVVSVDRIIVRPKWTSILRKTFSVHNITLINPNLDIRFDSLGSNSLQKAFLRKDSTKSRQDSDWVFRGAAIQIRNASLHTHSEIFAPEMESGFLIDFENLDIVDIDIAANIDFSEDSKQIDLLNISGRLVEPELSISSGESQIVISDGQLAVNQMGIRIGKSSFSLSGFLGQSISGGSVHDLPFLFDLEPSHIDFDELHGLFPAFQLRGDAIISSHIQGPLSDITVSSFRMETAGSNMEIEGTIRGYPDSLSVDLSLISTPLSISDLKRSLPQLSWVQDLRVDSLSVRAYLQGVAILNKGAIQHLNTRGSLDISSDGGLLSGSFAIRGTPQKSLNHDVSARIENVDLAKWTNRARLQSDLSGTIRARGFSYDPDSVYSSVTASFQDISWVNRSIESIEFDIVVDPDKITGGVILEDSQGQITSSGTLMFGKSPRLNLITKLENSNIGSLLGNEGLFTTINAEIRTSNSLSWDDRFSATIELFVDSSSAQLRDRSSAIPPFHAKVDIDTPDSTAGTVFQLDSDFIDVQISSSGSIPLLSSMAFSWLSGLKTMTSSEINKLLYPSPDVDDPLADMYLSDLLALAGARDAFSAGRHADPLESTFHIDVLDASMISSLAPFLPEISGKVKLDGMIEMTPEFVRLDFGVRSDLAKAAGFTSFGTEGSLSFKAERSESMAESMTWELEISADSVSSGNLTLGNQHIQSSFAHRHGFVEVKGVGSGGIDSLIVSAKVSNLDFVNNITFSQIRLVTPGGQWRLLKPAQFGFYSDATTLDQFELRYEDSHGPTEQGVSASGIFSSQSMDSLSVTTHNLSLLQFSDFMNFRRTLGGSLNTEMTFSGGLARPQIAGVASIKSFSLDDFIIGDLLLSSNFLSGRPDVEVDLRISPVPESRPFPRPGGAAGKKIVENELQISGRLRLPGQAEGDDGSLDLLVNVDRADLFFFKYIFQDALGNISGYASGDGSISGSLSRPLFDIKMRVWDGKFDIPRTQSVYRVESDVNIDEEAIHFTSTRIDDEQGGFAILDGKLLFNNYTALTLDIDGVLDEFQIMNVGESDELPFYGFLWASGTLKLEGALYDATLSSSNAVMRANSELFVPIEEELSETDESFIVFEDSLGFIPDFQELVKRPFIFARRRTGERQFLDGLNLDLSIYAPPGSTVHLVIDPLLGDVINARSTGNVQLILQDDEFKTYGQLSVDGGDYQFTAGELFVRRFLIDEGGTITWTGDPINAALNIGASYRTRASLAGLPGVDPDRTSLIPLVVDLQISGTVISPQVDLSLSVDRGNQNVLGDYQAIEAKINQPDRSAEYATSVLLTNSFQLTTENISTDSGSQLAFNSVSQLVSAQLNRFLNEALPNVDFSFGLAGESAADLDVTYGVALRLLDERLVIRSEGVYQGARTSDSVRRSEGLQGEFVVEIRMSPRVSIEVFFRREGDILEGTELTNTAGFGLSYQTDFDTWRSLFTRITGSSDVDF